MQVPAQVEYERAKSLDHALDLLKQHGSEAMLIAGGHSLLPMMKLRLVQPGILIDINDLAELSFVRIEGDEIVIGAMTRHSELLHSAIIREQYPIISEAERVIADPIVRNRGTVGGSICQADPSEDLSAVFSAIDAVLVLRGRGGTRTVLAREFHDGPYSTVRDINEVLVEVRVKIDPGVGSAYEKVERRVGDWAIAAAGALVKVADGHFTRVGIGLTAVGADHFIANEAEEFLLSKEATGENLQAAAQIASESCNPTADQRGPVDYKRHLVQVLTLRALTRATDRAADGGLK